MKTTQTELGEVCKRETINGEFPVGTASTGKGRPGSTPCQRTRNPQVTWHSQKRKTLNEKLIASIRLKIRRARKKINEPEDSV